MDVVIDREYRGDFVEIKDSLNLIIDKLNENFAEIANASDQVSSGANQISDGSQAEMLKEMVSKFKLRDSVQSAKANTTKGKIKSLPKSNKEESEPTIDLDDEDFGKY